MKGLLLLISSVLIILTGCSGKEDIKFRAVGTEAFAYGMGDSSEVDATTHLKGLRQNQKNNMYSSTLSYNIDLITPKGDTVKSIVSRVIDNSSIEKSTDTQLDAQFNIGSSFIKGKYKLIFNIKDVLTGEIISSAANFDL